MTFSLMRARQTILLACLIALPAVGMCGDTKIPANIHSVNYSDEEFEFWLEDPLDSKNRGGGESVEPFAASGTMCCYSLPKQWHSGIKVTIHARYSFKKAPGAELTEVPQVQTVEVPPYVDGKVGEIWVVRAGDGDLSIVSSDYQPNHEKWPGKVKGWPVPSVKYKRERFDIFIKIARDNLETDLILNQRMLENPDAQAKAAWDAQKKVMPQSIASFSGPDDITYRAYLVKNYAQSIIDSRMKLQELIDRRP